MRCRARANAGVLLSILLTGAAVALLSSVAAPEPPAANSEAGAPPPERPFTFAVIGGSHIGLLGQPNPVTGAMAVDIAGLRPDLVLGTGDYVEGSPSDGLLQQQYQRFFEALAPLQQYQTVPVALAVGRPEAGRSSRQTRLFAQYFGQTTTSFDRGGCHFIVLNTEIPGEESRIAGAQWEWLKRDLAQSRSTRRTFVVMHSPLFPADGEVGLCLDRYPKYRDALHALFAQSGVTAVFAGRERLYNHRRLGNVDYYLTAGAGGPLNATIRSGSYYHYLLVQVAGASYTVDVRTIAPASSGPMP
jgi:hypothetical protein